MSARRSLIITSLGLSLILLACGSSGGGGGGDGDGDQDPPAIDANVDADAEDEGALLAQCSDVDLAEVKASVAITSTFDESVHELIICGGIVVKLVDAVFAMTKNLVEGKASGELAGGLVYLGDGIFQTETDTTVMKLWFTVGADFRFAKQGEVIPENLLDSDNYLKGIAVTGSPLAPEFTFDEPGPLYELLKPGDPPTSPLSLAVTDVSKLVARFRKFGVQGDIAVKDEKGAIDVTYHVTLSGDAITDVLTGRVGYEVKTATASHEALAQTLQVVQWGLAYENDTLSGVLASEVRGGAVDFDASFDYTNGSGYADISLSCVD